MVRNSFLITLLLVVVVGLIIFYMAGGSVDIDAEVNSPQVEVDPGALPDVNVEQAPEADAGDNE
jgi:hypothetical protein